MAACVIYGWWAGRDRARAYFSLMLFLTGAIVGVFTAQDLLLFYAFFEAMLIPLYVLIGVWGGPQRLRATLTFVDLHRRRLAADARGDRRLRAAAGHVRPDAHGHVVVDVALPRLRGRVRDQVAALPVPRLAARSPTASRRRRCRRCSPGVVSKAGLYGLLRIAIPKFPDVVDDWRVVILVLASISLVYGSLLAFRAPDFRGVIPTRRSRSRA